MFAFEMMLLSGSNSGNF